MITATKPASVNKTFQVVSYGLGVWTAGLAVAQMVSFEEFVQALRNYQAAGQDGTVILAIMLIALEVFSVPFLFRLTLSPLARMVSALFVVLLPCAWTVLTSMVLLGGVSVPNAGYFGGFLTMQLSALILMLDVAWLATVGLSFGPLGGHRALKLPFKVSR